MREWTLVGTATVPGSETTLTLHQSDRDFVIRLSGTGSELMSTRRRGSEEALGRLPFSHIPNPDNATVLVGGLGMGFVTYCLALAEVARGSLSLAACAAMQSLMGTHFLYALGGEEIHDRLLKPALQGTKIGTICITEPDAGSDLASISTAASG